MAPAHLLSVGVVVRDTKDNPWLERLMTSIETQHSGVLQPEVLLEEGPKLSKVEKKIRVFRGCRTRYLLMLEDDTELLVPGWGAALIQSFELLSRTGIVGPLEVGFGVDPSEAARNIKNGIVETANLGGFCMFLDTTLPICWDVRIQTMDDLYISLLARSLGYRLVTTFSTVVRHTKQPWLPDGTPPWEQKDRTRFGEGDAYYEKERHIQKRLAESRLLIDWFGDLARATIPSELMAVLEPGKKLSDIAPVMGPSCTLCQKRMTLDDDFVMVRSSFPVCVACYQKGVPLP